MCFLYNVCWEWKGLKKYESVNVKRTLILSVIRKTFLFRPLFSETQGSLEALCWQQCLMWKCWFKSLKSTYYNCICLQRIKQHWESDVFLWKQNTASLMHLPHCLVWNFLTILPNSCYGCVALMVLICWRLIKESLSAPNSQYLLGWCWGDVIWFVSLAGCKVSCLFQCAVLMKVI